MAAMATGPSPRMPPAGGPTPGERERFADWVTCGAPGPVVQARCTGETWQGDLAASTAPPDLCPTTRWVTGDLVIDGPHGAHLLAMGRRKWRSQGGYPTLTHGGLSLLEVLSPFVEISK